MKLFLPNDYKVVVMNREDFEDYVKGYLNKDTLESIEDTAFIEIYTGPKGKPILPKCFNRIALNFDDWPAEIKLLKPLSRPATITITQAKALVKFIRKHWGKNFIIHCDAGVSRSQQVASFILMMSQVWGTLEYFKSPVSLADLANLKSWKYEYDDNLSTHGHHYSQIPVLLRLLEAEEILYPKLSRKYFKYNAKERCWYEKV